ncbi:MAG: DUF86 domain-containing protein [Thermomicrobiales bacterium]
MQPRVGEALADAMAACDYVQRTIAGLAVEDYVRDEDARSIVERKLIVIGEAFVRVRQHDPETFEGIADARQAIALRNIIVHDYNDIDDARVFGIVSELLPILRDSIARVLADDADRPEEAWEVNEP